ncbi:hypothetical protein BN871_FG_00140 [Paenibacillus sp. P22]|nr:hypothetical protein BN871_FG_00140 [Paenibacillus sp. P22]
MRARQDDGVSAFSSCSQRRLVGHGQDQLSFAAGLPAVIRHILRMRLRDELHRICVALHLLGIFAAGNDGSHRRMAKAPGERPGSHADAFRHFLLRDPANLLQPLPHLPGVLAMAHIRLAEFRAGLVLAAQEAARQRHPRQHAEILLQAGREYPLLRLAVEPVVHDLDRLRADLRGGGRLMQVVVAADGRAQMPDLAGLHLLVQRRPQLVAVEGGIGTGVELVQIHIVRLQSLQRRIQLTHDIFPGKYVRTLEPLMEMMAELRRDDPVLASPPADVVSDESFRQMVSVTFGRVDQVDAELGALVQNRVDLALREIHAPFPAELPGADADDRHVQLRFA